MLRGVQHTTENITGIIGHTITSSSNSLSIQFTPRHVTTTTAIALSNVDGDISNYILNQLKKITPRTPGELPRTNNLASNSNTNEHNESTDVVLHSHSNDEQQLYSYTCNICKVTFNIIFR